jgi:hypothetical protein
VGWAAGTYRLRVEIRNPNAPAEFPSEWLALHTFNSGQQRQLTAVSVAASTMVGAQVPYRICAGAGAACPWAAQPPLGWSHSALRLL